MRKIATLFGIIPTKVQQCREDRKIGMQKTTLTSNEKSVKESMEIERE